jgi:hypothetical protein
MICSFCVNCAFLDRDNIYTHIYTVYTDIHTYIHLQSPVRHLFTEAYVTSRDLHTSGQSQNSQVKTSKSENRQIPDGN